MRRILTLSLGLAVSACASTAPAAAQRPGPDSPRTLDVSAQAAVTRTPDRAVIELAVETLAASARAATSGNAEAMTAVLAALDGLGIDRSAIQTRSIALNPRYDRRPDAGEPTITGYQAVNHVSVRVDGVERVGPVVDAAVEAGANRVTGIRFELSDPEEAYHEALRLAIGQARREAEVAAAALDETLGPVIAISTAGFDAPAPQGGARMMQAEAATPVQPGELEVRARVSITYRLGT